jgi:tRNA pseudouridine38-40 synthase
MKAAIRKTYRYRVDRSAYGDPLIARYALHHPHELDLPRMLRGLERLTGRHDFSGFADSRCRIEHRVRDLAVASYEETGAEGWFRFTANGFLTYMVRNMVGTLLAIGSGRLPVECVDRMLETGDRRLGGPTASPRGLCLWEVVYPPDAGSVADDGDSEA